MATCATTPVFWEAGVKSSLSWQCLRKICYQQNIYWKPASFHHSMHNCQEKLNKAGTHNHVFHATLLLRMKIHNATVKRINLKKTRTKKPCGKACFSHAANAFTAQSKYIWCSSAFVKNFSATTVLAEEIAKRSAQLDSSSLMIESLDSLSKVDDAAYCRAYILKAHKISNYAFIPKNKRHITRFHDSKIIQLPTSIKKIINQPHIKMIKK